MPITIRRDIGGCLLATLGAVVGVALSGSSAEAADWPTGVTIAASQELPIEVFGNDEITVPVTFDLPEATDVEHVYLRVHRPAYYDAVVNPARGAKASVKLNDGSWVDLTNETVRVDDPAAQFGGIGGGFHTLDLTFYTRQARAGINTLYFRFNGTDGFTNGYRVLDVELRRGGREGPDALSPEAFLEERPGDWLRPAPSNAAARRGRQLWEEARLAISPLQPDVYLTSKCADCHAADGRDLQYFNYSNRSIATRSQFHGLTEAQGNDIAAYIRSLDVGYVEAARPWNPPYQPGEGLDDKPTHEWAAGAGLDAVLARDADMLPHLFPAGHVTTAELAEVIDIKRTLNTRELPIPIQLPDWNDWLPHLHPVDFWGDEFAESEAMDTYGAASSALRRYADGAESHDVARDTVPAFLLATWRLTMKGMGGPQPCLNYNRREGDGRGNGDVLMTRLPDGFTCEDGLSNTNRWLAVKNWELFHGSGVEDRTDEMYTHGEARGWFGNKRNVFEVAPHRVADNSKSMRHQDEANGAYASNAWYHLQLILNHGHRDPYQFQPQDWFYTGNWLALNARRNETNLATFFTATHLKMLQNLNTTGPDGRGVDKGPDNKGWWVSFVIPSRLDMRLNSEDGFPLNGLDPYHPDLRRRVVAATLTEWLWKTRTYPIDALPRKPNSDGKGGGKYESVDYIVPTDIPDPDERCFYSCPGQSFIARDIYRFLYRMRDLGVDAEVRDEVIDWCAEVWPHPDNDWDALRGYNEGWHELTVVGGSGSDHYRPNSLVTIAADPPPQGQRFVRWEVSGPGQFADPIATSTVLTTGRSTATVRAVYAPVPPEGSIVIRASGACGTENLVLEVGGVDVLVWNDVSPDGGEVLYSGPVAGPIRVRFDNPGTSTAGACERTLTVEFLERDGVRHLGAEQSVNTGQRNSSGACDADSGTRSAELVCGGYIEFAEVGDATSSIGAPADGRQVSVSPNPVQRGGTVTIGLQFASGAQTLLITDLQGRIAYRTPVPFGRAVPIQLPALPAGVYFLKIQANDGISAAKRLVVTD